ncbi:hypothetical protein BDZ45DRAFT_695686 [Acephala macrosclerotiorum]|nr:hypothetical protein BDZ45DRAFT_695686 [Acephala macrosclerotiorum]
MTVREIRFDEGDTFAKQETYCHCIICDSENYDICQGCKDLNHNCPGYHPFYARTRGLEEKDGLDDDDDAEAAWEDEEDGFDEIICDNCEMVFPKRHAQYFGRNV